MVQFYCGKGLAESTQKTYRVALNRYSQFCTMYGVNPFPVSESPLCYFVASLARQGLTPATIRTYLAGVRHAQIMRGFEEPRQHSTLPCLHLLQAGVKQVRCQQGTHQARQRLPILPNHLRQIRAIWGASPDPDALMLWAAVTLKFFGFFHSGEIAVPSVSAFSPNRHLCWSDVSVDSRHTPTMLRVHLKVSKCDQFSQGVECTSYSGHSFRIGAATTAAMAGVADSVIQAHGRWSSTAFLGYIRTPREQLAGVARVLARTN